MREKQVCRRCEELAQGLVRAKRRSFAIAGATPHYAPDLPFRTEHIRLEVDVDPERKTVAGRVTHRVRAVAGGKAFLELDQIGIDIREATVRGKPARWEIAGQKLRIFFGEGREPAEDEKFEFDVRFSAVNPPRGLYFTGPDADYPNKPHQVWAQGQDEDNRYWFPSFDYPNQKATSEVVATVPRGYTAVSNGALLGREEKGGRVQFHYRIGVPHVVYLITLTVAEFSAWEDRGPRGLPVQYFVAPGREEDGKRAFSHTPKMIEAFEKMIGVPYPYEKYSQVAVQDFIFGGMENTSATTQTDLTLHDARAHLDFSSDPLVSHELAHQWFGDLLTCRDWSHGWLNEGFATFMERVWIENSSAEDGGIDEASYYSLMDLREYQEEDAHAYRRPIVCNTYIEPIDLFDTHLYQKGGLVLNLLRAVLGKDAFWKAVRLYVERHREGSVETLDLVRAIEDATGRNLRRFFDEWVFSAGYPEFEIAYAWHEQEKLAEITIEQKQTEGKPALVNEGVTTPIFHVPVRIEAVCEGGQRVAVAIELSEARDRVFLACPSKPTRVRFDPGNFIPKALKFPRPKEMLLDQLARDEDCTGRIEAAIELGKIVDASVVAALARALLAEKFWGVQAEIAAVLATVRTDAARDALIAGLGVKHPKARRAVVNALGSFHDDAAANALEKLARKDASYFVEGDAALSSARARIRPGVAADDVGIQRAEALLLGQLDKDSYRETIRASALMGLGKLPGLGRGERPRAMKALIEWSARGKPEDARLAAIIALGSAARAASRVEQARVLEVLAALADEPAFRIRRVLIAALRATETREAAAILAKIQSIELDGRNRRHAGLAIEDITAAGSAPETVAALQESLTKLEDEHRKLKAAVESANAKGAAQKSAGSPRASKRSAPKRRRR